MARRRRFVLALLHTPLSILPVALLVGACSRGQIGGEVDGGEGSNGDDCVVAGATSLDVDEASSLGFSGRDVLEWLPRTSSVPLVWRSSHEMAQLTPAAGDSRISFEVIPREDSFELVDLRRRSSDGRGSGAALHGDGCQDELRFEAEVRVSSENGAFDDTFRATFRAPTVLSASTSIDIEPGELRGSFDVTVVGLDDGRSVQTRLELSFAAGSVGGWIEGIVEDQGDDTTTAGFVEYGHFPVERCDLEGIWVDPESNWPRALLEEVTASRTFEIEWDSGARSELSIEHEAGKICFSPSLLEQGPLLWVELASRARSEDGRIDGSWNLEGQVVLSNRGELQSLSVLRQAHLVASFPAGEFEAESGIHGVDAPGAKHLTFSFEYGAEGDGLASGALEIYGQDQPGCDSSFEEEEGGFSTSGCEGVDSQRIARARLIEIDPK